MSKIDPLGLIPIPIENRERFLRFVLSKKNDVLLPLTTIQEVTQISVVDMLPVPDVGRSVVGLCSWQGKTIWLIDLNELLGYLPLHQQSSTLGLFTVIVVQHQMRSLGLVVEQVEDIDLFDPDSIHFEPGLCPPSVEPFVLGYSPQVEGCVSTVLSVPAIAEALMHASSISQNLLPV